MKIEAENPTWTDDQLAEAMAKEMGRAKLSSRQVRNYRQADIYVPRKRLSAVA